MKKIIYILLSILVLVLCLLIIEWTDIKQYYDEKEKKEQYEKLMSSIQEPKLFRSLSFDNIGIDYTYFSTKWANGKLYYKLKVFCNNLRSCTFEVKLLDENGYAIESFNVYSSSMAKGEGCYEVNSDTFVKPEIYKQVSDWTMTYRESRW